jgi:hypothetical protein
VRLLAAGAGEGQAALIGGEPSDLDPELTSIERSPREGNMIARHGFATLAVLALACGGSIFAMAIPAAAETDAAKEVSTAAQHAGLAAASKDMKATQMHLHHVVNCLAGPNDANYDAAAGNPCKDQGNGAIPDTAEAAKKAPLRLALQQALTGLKQTDMAAAQKDATAAQGTLK